MRLSNDLDPDDSASVQSVTQPTNGSVAVATGGLSVTYTPNTGYCNSPPGTTLDTFTYTLNGGSSATVTVTVTCVVDNPTAVDDTATVTEDDAATPIDVLANDTDPDDNAAIQSVTDPANGAAVITGGGSGLTYQPDPNYCNTPPGTTLETFTYTLNGGSSATVTVTVSCVVDNPTAVNDTATVLEDAAATSINVLANDSDPDGTGATIQSASDPANGTTAITGGGTGLTYQPDANFCGSDSFTYTLNGGSVGTVSVTVTCVNDAPSFTKGADQTVAEDAGPQTVASWATAISRGPANESGQNVTFEITSNSNASLFSAGPAVSATGTLTFTPAANQNGTATIELRITDDGGTTNGGVNASATQTFVITVTAVNDAPVAQAKSFSAQANMKITGLTGLLTGVTDADSGVSGCTPSFSVASVGPTTTPAGGTISNVNTATGTFDFDPPPGVTGNVTFSYTVQDTGCPGTGTSAPATITVNVAGPVIWFVDDSAAAGGDGRLSAPFNTLAGAAAVDAANHRVFLYSGTYSTGIALNTGEWLVGQGVTGFASFDALMGITPPTGTIARPSIGTGTTTVQGTVTLNANTFVRALALSTGASAGLNDTAGAITGVDVAQTSVATTTGTAVALSDIGGTITLTALTTNGGSGATLTGANGAASFAFTGVTVSSGANSGISSTGGGTLTVTGTANTLTSTTGTALNVTNTTIGAAGLTFQSISASGAVNGIVLNTTGSGGLTVTGSGTTAGSGGTIQNTSNRGASFISASNVSLSNMNFTNAGNTDLDPDNSGLSTGDNLATNAAIHLQTVTNATLTRIAISGGAEQGINVNAVSNFVLSSSSITNAGNEPDEDGIHFFNMTGTSSITNTTITCTVVTPNTTGGDDNLNLQMQAGTLNLTISGGSATNANKGSGYLFGIRGSANATIQFQNASSTGNFSGGIVADAFNSATMNLTVSNSTSSGNNDQLSVSAGDSSNVDVNASGNTLSSVATGDFVVVSLLGSAFDTGYTLDARIQNNTISVANGLTADGIAVFNAGGSDLNLVISGNTITYAGTQRAILIQGGQDGPSDLDATVTGNAIDIQLDGAGNAVTGILAQSQVASPSGDGSSLCANIGGAGLANTFTHSLGGTMAGGDIRVRQRFGGNVQLPGYAGGATDTAAVIAYLDGRNNEVSASTATVDAGSFSSAAACTQPNP